MAIKMLDNSYACSVCGSKYPTPAKADGCRDSHQMLYVPMSKTELNRLLNAIMLDDVTMIPGHLIDTLQRYARFQVTS